MTSTADFSFKTAESYLQNVLFIDDKIFDKGDPEAPPTATIPDEELDPSAIPLGGVEAINSERVTNDECTPETKEAHFDPPFNEREIADGFSEFGILCGLLQPRKDELEGSGTDSRLVRLSERADVVILDWDLYNDGGEKVKRLLVDLVESSQNAVPHHSRLCVIYTNTPSLHSVMQSLSHKLEAAELEFIFDEEGLKIDAGSALILILGKPNTPNRSDEEIEKFEVSEAKLAHRVITEFASHHRGLLPGLTLTGLTALRRNSKRLLDRLTSKLDGAFLLHRALTLGADDDALSQFPELLSEEILAVLEDEQYELSSLKGIADIHIDELQLNLDEDKWKDGNGQSYDIEPTLRKALKAGRSEWKKLGGQCFTLKELRKQGDPRELKPKLLKDLGESVAGSLQDCERMVEVFSHRTQYLSNYRKLHFGTIIRHRAANTEEPWRFSVCLMPVCDCQRLGHGSNVQFPFWRLRNNVFCGQPEKRFGTSVTDPDAVSHSLAAGGKIRDMLWIQEFEAGSEGCVMADLATNSFKFSDPTDTNEIEWVAELKPLHAQRIAAEVGAKASRVGLVESEWLRLFCDR